jgi:hypothetical protein
VNARGDHAFAWAGLAVVGVPMGCAAMAGLVDLDPWPIVGAVALGGPVVGLLVALHHTATRVARQTNAINLHARLTIPHHPLGRPTADDYKEFQ